MTVVTPPRDGSEASGFLSTRLKLGWGVGSLAMSAMLTAVSILLIRYLVDYVALSAATAGLLVAASKIYDAFTDPVMGVISDRTNTRWGRRRPFLLLGGVVCAASFYMMFSVPSFESESTKAIFVFVALLLNATGYTIFNVPYLAMPAEMSDNFSERTTLISFRVGFVAIGQFVASVIGPMLLAYFGGDLFGHSAMAGIIGAIIFASCAISFFSTKDARQSSVTKRIPVASKEYVTSFLQNGPFMVLSITKLFQLIGTALFLGIIPFIFFRVIPESSGSLSLFFLIITVCFLVSQPLWVFIANRYSNKIAYYFAAAAYSASIVSWVFAAVDEPVSLVVARAIVAGVGGGGLLLIGQALLPETIEYDSRKTGLNREAIYSGMFTFIEKSAYSLGAAITGFYLAAIGYVSGTGATGGQSESTLEAIRYAALLPPGFFILSSIAITFYTLNEKTVKEAGSAQNA